MNSEALFAEACKVTVHRWTALNLAVHNDWGQGNSSEKRDNMVAEICSGFANKKGGRGVDPSELEQFLDDFLLHQFNTEADDESPYEVSHLLCKLHELIMAGEIQEAQNLLSSPVTSLDKCVAEQGFDSDIGGDSSEGEDDEMVDGPPPEPEQLIISEEQQADLDDGWGVVVKTNKGRTKAVGGAGMDMA